MEEPASSMEEVGICNNELMTTPSVEEIPINNENAATNNNTETNTQNNNSSNDKLSQHQTCKSRKRKRFLSQQQQRKNNKNWKINKYKRQQQQEQQQFQSLQSEKSENNMDLIKFNYNNGRKLNFAMIKFNKNNLGRGCRQRPFPISSKFFLPEKRPCKNLIIPPTKFLLGGNISDPLNLNSLQNGDPSMGELTPKSSPITTPPKIEVIIPPNIHDPLHLLDPVDAIEYQKQLTSPLKRRKKVKHRNRNKKRNRNEQQKLNVQSLVNHPINSTETNVASSSKDIQNETGMMADQENKNVEIPITTTVEQQQSIEDESGASGSIKVMQTGEREKAIKEMKLDLPEPGGRKRRISESHQNGKVKVRRMDSMDKIVSPVIPQPGAWKRLPRIIPSGAPRGGVRNRSKPQSSPSGGDNKPEDISPMEENQKDILHPAGTGERVSETQTTEMNELEGANPSISEKPDNVTEPSSKFKNSNAKYQYGNYDRYYGYRNLNEFMDVRLKVFTRFPYLFRDKDVLDIGCNAGHITTAVAKDLGVSTITGIDIDPNLIEKARKNVSLYVRIPEGVNPQQKREEEEDSKLVEKEEECIEGTSKKTSNAINLNKNCTNYKLQRRSNKYHTKMNALNNRTNDEFFPISFSKCYGIIPDTDDMTTEGSGCSASGSAVKLRFPKNVFFKTSNYVPKDESMLNLDTQQYDLIMCLSATKWIHLNFGDAGLKLAFKRMFNQLRPGGKLILEAQNWASYKKKKKLTEKIFANYKSIEFYPNKFHEYLLGPDVGFSHSYALGIPRHLSKGFRRPIQLYIKGDFTPSQVRWSDTYQSQTPYEPYRGIYAEPIVQPRTYIPNKTVWGNETPYGGNGNYSYRFTPSQNLSATSQYYNPYETDTYLPSYNMDTQKRQYCFASPIYSAVWSPPASSRGSASHTPVSGSIREEECNEDGTKSKHVYPPTDDFNPGKMSNRSEENEPEKSPKAHIYVNTESNPSTSSSDNSNPI